MHRTDASGHVNGGFTDGNPAIGQLATAVDAAWLNAVQESICDIIEFAGIELVKGDDTQLRDAVVALIAGVVGDGSGAVPTTRRVDGAGLLSGGGQLAANLTLTLAAATAAQIRAGTAGNLAVSAANLAAAFTGLDAATGHMTLPGGKIVQWGQLRGNFGQTQVSVTFPVAFSAAPWSILSNAFNQGANSSVDTFTQNVSRSETGFTAYFQDDGGGGGISGLDWIAIGK